MTFGQRLRALRKAAGMTQRELAQKTGISFAYVSKLETGVMSPPRERIILALARVLDADDAVTDELFGLAGKVPSELLEHIDPQMIRMLRSLKYRERLLVDELGTLRLDAGLQASETQHLRPESALRREEEPFRAIVENSMDGIVVLGSELEVLYENPSAARILGYESGEFVGKDVLGLIHPDDMSKTAHRLTILAQTPGDADRAHLRVRHRDGTWRAIDVFANNLLHDPSVKGIIIDYRDVSGRLLNGRAWTEQAAALATAKEYRLTESELRVLTLMVDGQSNTQIAEQLVISPSTVRFHVSSILHKLGVTNRSGAVALAVRRRLVI